MIFQGIFFRVFWRAGAGGLVLVLIGPWMDVLKEFVP